MTRILIVEDSPTQAEQLQCILTSHGFEVVCANDGQKGLECFKSSPFDIVLSDILMPGISGYELCRRIKAHSPQNDVPVILLTALNEPSDILEGLTCGADNFITKPYDEEYLVGRIRHVLANRCARTQRRVDLGVELQFMGKRLIINSDKEQILDLLISALEEVHRSKQREYELKLLEQKQRHEAEASRLREETVRKDREDLRAIVETMPTAVAIVCPDGQIHFANRTFLGVAAQGPHRALSDWASRLKSRATFRQELNHYLDEALNHPGRLIRFDINFRRHDGHEVDWVMHLQRLRTVIGGKPAVMIAGVDVSDQKRLIVQLSNARSQMEDFLAAAAHDLKAPLITIGHNVNFARMGLGSNIPADTAKCLDRVQSAAREMLTLLGQVSAVSNAGRDTEPRLKHSSRELVRTALRQLDGILAERHAKVTVHDDMPDVSCQGTKLIQVFSNLITNAVKYSAPDRNPVIEIGSLDSNGSEHRFFVRDNGVGIPQESLEEIFELFRRLSTDPNVDGQGVGLTIVKRVVELHGGRVWVESKAGTGSTFYFTIARRAEGDTESTAAAVPGALDPACFANTAMQGI